MSEVATTEEAQLHDGDNGVSEADGPQPGDEAEPVDEAAAELAEAMFAEEVQD